MFKAKCFNGTVLQTGDDPVHFRILRKVSNTTLTSPATKITKTAPCISRILYLVHAKISIAQLSRSVPLPVCSRSLLVPGKKEIKIRLPKPIHLLC